MTGAYTWEEVLQPLGPARRRVLAVVADLGGADADLAAAALGEPVDLATVLDGVPLVARTADGWYVPHAMWREAPGLALDAATADATRRRAAEYLTALDRFDDAFSLAEEAETGDLVPDVLRAACLASDRLASGQLERWLAAVPPDVRSSTAGTLARGLLAAFTAPAEAVEPLRAAIARCRADDDIDAEMTAIAQLARLAWFSQDDDILGELVGRVMEIEAATGHPAAAGLSKVAQAALMDLTGDDDTMLALFESIGPSVLDRAWELLVAFWAAQVRLGLGETEPIHRIAERLDAGDDPALRGAGLALQVSAWWAAGKVELVLTKLPEMLTAMRAAGVQNNLYLALNGASLASARVGDLAQARRWFDESLAAAPPTPTGDMTLRSAMALAYLQLAAGDEAQAGETLRRAIEIHGFNEGIDRDTWRQHIAVSYVLLPETRAHWDGVTLRGHLERAHRLARAVVAGREGKLRRSCRASTCPSPARCARRWTSTSPSSWPSASSRRSVTPTDWSCSTPSVLRDRRRCASWPPGAAARPSRPRPFWPRCRLLRRGPRTSRCSVRWSCGGIERTASWCPTPTSGGPRSGRCWPSSSPTARPPAWRCPPPSDLFVDLPDAEWGELDREHYRVHFVSAAVRAGQLLLGRGDPDTAEEVARKALAVDRWTEEAYAVLVGAAMSRRDRVGAHRMLTRCLDALRELGARPSPATRQLKRRLQGATL